MAPAMEGQAAEIDSPTCDSEVSADIVVYTGKVPPYPTVNCRITLTGYTILSFQWGNN